MIHIYIHIHLYDLWCNLAFFLAAFAQANLWVLAKVGAFT